VTPVPKFEVRGAGAGRVGCGPFAWAADATINIANDALTIVVFTTTLLKGCRAAPKAVITA
jgi:hypothetical protein